MNETFINISKSSISESAKPEPENDSLTRFGRNNRQRKMKRVHCFCLYINSAFSSVEFRTELDPFDPEEGRFHSSGSVKERFVLKFIWRHGRAADTGRVLSSDHPVWLTRSSSSVGESLDRSVDVSVGRSVGQRRSSTQNHSTMAQRKRTSPLRVR